MTNKEYREKYQGYATYDWGDYLTPYEVKELRRDIRKREARGSVALDGSNNRASIRRDGNAVILTSYYTDVCAVTMDGAIYRMWDGYSVTTMRHINLFLRKLNNGGVGKREWFSLPEAYYDGNRNLISNETGEILNK